MRIRPRTISCILVLSATFSTAMAEATLHSDRSTISAFPGIHAPTSWLGDTDVIDLDLNQLSASDLSFISLSKNFGSRFSINDGPIQLYEAFRKGTAYSASEVYDSPIAVGRAQQQLDPSSTNDGLMNSSSAVYAQVLNQQDVLLARGDAFSVFDSELTHRSFQANGSLSAESFVHEVLAHPRTTAHGTSNANLRALYEVTEEMDFIIDATLTGTAGLDLTFQVTDLSSNENIVSQSLLPGMQQRIEHCGSLSPGNYRVELVGHANVPSNASDAAASSIEGAYDIYFAAFPFGGQETKPAEELDGLVWISRNGETAISVPEPSASTMLICIAVAAAMRRRRSEPLRS